MLLATDSDSSSLLASGLAIFWVALVAFMWVVVLVALIRVIQKAGYSGWWALIGLVPIVNLVMFLVFAYGRWPVLEENARLRHRLELPPGR